MPRSNQTTEKSEKRPAKSSKHEKKGISEEKDKKKKKLTRSQREARINKEIKDQQRSTKLHIPRASVQRMMKRYILDHHGGEMIVQREAVDLYHAALEAIIVDILSQAQFGMEMITEKTTLTKRHMIAPVASDRTIKAACMEWLQKSSEEARKENYQKRLNRAKKDVENKLAKENKRHEKVITKHERKKLREERKKEEKKNKGKKGEKGSKKRRLQDVVIPAAIAKEDAKLNEQATSALDDLVQKGIEIAVGA
jgi:histone H3/H4